jgi:hypothetical protein
MVSSTPSREKAFAHRLSDDHAQIVIGQIDIAAHLLEVFLADLHIHAEGGGIGIIPLAHRDEAPREEFVHLASGRKIAGKHFFHDGDLGAEPEFGHRLHQRVLAVEVAAQHGGDIPARAASSCIVSPDPPRSSMMARARVTRRSRWSSAFPEALAIALDSSRRVFIRF